MIRLDVRTKRPYEVCITTDALADFGKELSMCHTPCRVMVVTDTNLSALYGNRVEEVLTAAGFACHSFVIPSGETSKNPETLIRLLEACAGFDLNRQDLILAFGGGVVGDLAGFAASVYMRGIDFVQMPTSLLAMVDSSIGGKTAVNLLAGKNLCGTFWQPLLVWIDTAFLKTLPEKEISCGMGEVIKYAVLFDAPLFEALQSGKMAMDESAVAACVTHKIRMIEADEFDCGDRRFLNFGHSFGHGVEAGSGYTLSHGEAVAVGMMSAAKIAAGMGVCAPSLPAKVETVLSAWGLPANYPLKKDEAVLLLAHDKKCSAKQITLVLPEKIGVCRLVELPFEAWIEALEQAGCFSK